MSTLQEPDDLSRGDMTRIALIEAAESLFAEAGVDGASTRRIGAAIGSANKNVVAYHFGSKEELIRAIYRHRLPQIDARRRELLDAADAAGLGTDPAALVRAFHLPFFEQTDGAGRHSYARFIAGLERSGRIATRGEVTSEFPETDRLSRRIRACLAPEIAPLLDIRIRLTTGLVASALLQIDQDAADDAARARELFDNAIAMAVAALAAPAPDK